MTGYHAVGGLRALVTFHRSTRGLAPIELWATGGRYTIETGGRVMAAGNTESAARDQFERAVEAHYECPECGEPTPRALHLCVARD